MVYEILPTIWSCSAKKNTCCANWSKKIGTSNNKVSFKIVAGDVVFTKVTTSQTRCKHHYRLYLTMEKPINPLTTGSTGKLLVADVHRAQQTDGIKALLKKKNTEFVNVPPGCTSRVQPLDVSFDKPFKDVVRQLFEKHLEGNLQWYTEGKISASEEY